VTAVNLSMPEHNALTPAFPPHNPRLQSAPRHTTPSLRDLSERLDTLHSKRSIQGERIQCSTQPGHDAE
jgi:hypothetical protein